MKHPPESPLDGVSRETQERLQTYETLLLKWNDRINLVSRQDAGQLRHRHFRDSLQLVPLIPSNTVSAIDLGSGAGFPGLVLSIATGIAFTLIEADQRKAAFLREVGAAVSAPIHVVPRRIEDAGVAPAQLVTARALAPLAVLLRFAAPLLAKAGTAIFPKGKTADKELTEAVAAWNMRVERFPSQTDPDGVIFRLSEVSPV